MNDKEIKLEIQGMGIILYSDFAVKHIKEGENYLQNSYIRPTDVVRHINEGTIVGFCTGSPGEYILRFKEGEPTKEEANSCDFRITLGIEVRDERICIGDLFELIAWEKENKDVEYINVENGYYHIMICSNQPRSGIIGDEQLINIYIKLVEEMPHLNYGGVPMLC